MQIFFEIKKQYSGNFRSRKFVTMDSSLHSWFSLRISYLVFFFTLMFYTGTSLVSAQSSWSNTPVIIRISDAVKPGSSFSINGEGFSGESLKVVMEIADDNNPPQIPSEGSFTPEIIQKDTLGQFIVLRFPDNLHAGIYNVWVRNSYGWSHPIVLNGPRALFQSEYEAWQGQSIQVTGRNFDGWEFGTLRNAKVRLVNEGTTYEQVLSNINPYCVTFITGNQPKGIYTVEISNDGGIHWVSPSSGQTLKIVAQGRDDFGLGVAWADTFRYDNVLDVSKNGVPVSSGTEVTAAVQALIELGAGQGGAIIYFPNGTYHISALTLPSTIVLMGEDMFKTQLIYTGNGYGSFIERQKTTAGYSGYHGIYQLAFRLSDPLKRPDRFITLGEAVGTPDKWLGTRIFVKKLSIEYPWDTPQAEGFGRGLGIILGGSSRILITDNHFVGFNARMSFTVEEYVHIKNNVLEVAGSGIGCRARYAFIENNDLEGHREILDKEEGSHGIMLRDMIYAYRNRVSNFGIGNDGEGICSEIPNGLYKYGKTKGSTTLSVITDSTLVYPDFWSYGLLSVQIVNGTGLGQTRTVKFLSGKTIIVDKPWDVIPDTTSWWSLTYPNQQNTIYQNTIIGCGAGYVMYGNWLDGVVANNVSINSLGISLMSGRRPTGLSTGYFNRIARNSVQGESWRVNMATISAYYSVSDKNSLPIKTTGLYGTEILENIVSGDPLTDPKEGYTVQKIKAGIGVTQHTGSTGHYGGYWSGSEMISRDQLNSIIEKNTVKKQTWGIEITRGNYGVVICDNKYEEIDSGNLWVEPSGNLQSVINKSCGLSDAINLYSVQVEIIDSISGEPVGKLEVVLNGDNYLTNSMGIFSSSILKEGYYHILLPVSRYEIAGNDMIEVRSDSLIRVLVNKLPIYSVQIEFADTISGELIENLEVSLLGITYITNNEGIIDVPRIRKGSYYLVLPDYRFEIAGTDNIEVNSDSLIRVLVRVLPINSIQIEFIDTISGLPIEGLEVNFHEINYITNNLGIISPPELLDGNYKLFLPDKRFEFAGNGIIEVHSDSLLRIFVTRIPELTLKVINKTSGSSIYRAVVKIDGISYFSGTTGLVSTFKYPLATITVSAEHNDYFILFDTLIITVDTTIVLTLTPKRANVTFNVSDLNGPLSGVKVSMPGSQYTNSAGNAFFFSQQARSDYVYTLERAGYNTIKDTIYLEIDTTLIILLDKVTSVFDSDYKEININPNPFDTHFDITVQEKSHLSIYNGSGILIYSKTLEQGLNSIQTPDFKQGVYIVKFVTGDKVYNKLLINNSLR